MYTHQKIRKQSQKSHNFLAHVKNTANQEKSSQSTTVFLFRTSSCFTILNLNTVPCIYRLVEWKISKTTRNSSSARWKQLHTVNVRRLMYERQLPTTKARCFGHYWLRRRDWVDLGIFENNFKSNNKGDIKSNSKNIIDCYNTFENMTDSRKM